MAPESAAAGAVPATALQRALQRFAKVEPRESAAVLTTFLLFFFVLGSYFAVRPVRETIGTLLGRDRVADLWLYTAIFSIAIVPIYGWLVGRVRRSLPPERYRIVRESPAQVGASDSSCVICRAGPLGLPSRPIGMTHSTDFIAKSRWVPSGDHTGPSSPRVCRQAPSDCAMRRFMTRSLRVRCLQASSQ